MTCFTIYCLYHLIVAIINSIGKKWNDELGEIWRNQLKKWLQHIWIPIVIELVIILITLIFTGGLISYIYWLM